MTKEIMITRKQHKKGDDGYKVISVRMKESLIFKLDQISADSNRSRNELINIILSDAADHIKIIE